MIRLFPNENRHIIIQEIFNEKKSKKLCIISHYDSKNIIEDYVCFMIKELYKLNFDVIIVSTANHISTTERNKIKKYLRAFVLKKNIGYDFISWKIGMSLLKDFEAYDDLLLLNDSIFFPLNKPKNMFNEMKNKKYDFWGLIDCYNRRYHIQSYFWYFGKKIKKSHFFTTFWNRCISLDDKVEIINKYETMFTSLVIKKFFHVGAYVETKKVILELNKLNISIPKDEVIFYSLWQFIITKFNAPLLKKNILCCSHKDFNPCTYYWKDVINETSYDSKLILKYLNRCNYKTFKNKFDWINSFIKLSDHLVFLKETNYKVLIYGYSYVGKLIHSILKENVSLIVDRNFESLNNINSTQIFSIDKIISVEFDKIIICSFGREKEIISLLAQYNIMRDKIIIVQDYLNVDSLIFSHFIVKLLKYFHSISYSRILGNELQWYNTDTNLIKVANNYLEFFNMPLLKTYPNNNDVQQNSIKVINPKTLEVLNISELINQINFEGAVN